MLKSFHKNLHAARNPLHRVKRRFPRYIIITSLTGLVSFLAALFFLHLGMRPLPSLFVAACTSGLFSYTAMELWAFPHREGRGRLSWIRLLQNAAVGIGGFAARYAVLTLILRHLPLPHPFNNAVPLILAYLASFLLGYALRCLVVFRK